MLVVRILQGVCDIVVIFAIVVYVVYIVIFGVVIKFISSVSSI